MIVDFKKDDGSKDLLTAQTTGNAAFWGKILTLLYIDSPEHEHHYEKYLADVWGIRYIRDGYSNSIAGLDIDNNTYIMLLLKYSHSANKRNTSPL
jgi:hypothetical protein